MIVRGFAVSLLMIASGASAAPKFIAHGWDLLGTTPEALEASAAAFGLGGVVVLDGILQKRVQPLDLLNRIVSLWHRHFTTPAGCCRLLEFLFIRKPTLTVSHRPYHKGLTLCPPSVL